MGSLKTLVTRSMRCAPKIASLFYLSMATAGSLACAAAATASTEATDIPCEVSPTWTKCNAALQSSGGELRPVERWDADADYWVIDLSPALPRKRLSIVGDRILLN